MTSVPEHDHRPGLAAEPPIQLGRSTVSVRPLGIGTWAWGDRTIWGYGRGYGAEDLAAAYHASLEAGITLFDTAELYGWGESERLLGSMIRPESAHATPPVHTAPNGPVTLDAPVVATKFFPYPWRVRQGDLLRALRGSLTRLGLPHVDLYQIHWPYPPRGTGTWMAALAGAVDAGLVRAVGVSNYSASQMRRAHEALDRRGIPLATNQIHYSLLHRHPERDGVLAAARELGVTIIAYSPLAMGLLTGKYGLENPPPQLRQRMFRQVKLARLYPLMTQIRAIGEQHGGKTPSQVVLNWLICGGVVPIPGAKNVRQAIENAGALGWRLTPAEAEQLNRLSAAMDG